MVRESVSVPVGHPLEPSLEGRIVERLHRPARRADEVVVVRAVRLGRLEARHAVAEIDPMDESEVGELLEHAVDARDPHLLPVAPQAVEELLRGEAALLLREVGDDLVPRRACPRSGAAELLAHVLDPPSCHAEIVVVLSRSLR